MLIIFIGSVKSLEEMIKQIKKVHVDGITVKDSSIEQMSFSGAV